jgi:hypothetical protein
VNPSSEDPFLAAAVRLAEGAKELKDGIRDSLTQGMTPKEIAEVMGLSAICVRLLINSWGLNR